MKKGTRHKMRMVLVPIIGPVVPQGIWWSYGLNKNNYKRNQAKRDMDNRKIRVN